MIGAIAMSPLFPVGVAREADPHVGFHIDWVVVGPGLVVVGAVVLAIAVVALPIGAPDGRRSAARPTRVRGRRGWSNAAAQAAAPPTLTNGLRMALEPGRGRSAVPVRSAYFGAVLGVLGVTAVLVFSASLDQLVTTPTRFGWTWGFATADTNFSNSAQGCGTSDLGLHRVEGVAAVAAVCIDGTQVDGRPVIGWGFTRLRGAISPGIVSGRGAAIRSTRSRSAR